MNLDEDGAAAGAPTNTTAGVKGPIAPIKAKQKNLFRRVSDIRKTRDLNTQIKDPLNK